ncbi:hypothetical protein QML37_31230, partial [Klebsiella pneumoniae]|uniref:hypothetical protein n=1 Tax=Klebsiella pneumoniae TaxID=573 RepID=UPI003A80F82B
MRAYPSRLDCINASAESSTGDVQINQALAAVHDKGNFSSEWIVDSGATHHMTGNPKVFQEYKLSSGNERVSLADGSSISVAGKGSLSVLNKFHVHNALHVPNIP